MNQIVDFFKGLLDSSKWPPRWKCGEWSDFHGWLYITSDLMIWLAYFLIPIIILGYFTGKKGLIHFRKVYVLFAAFILLCGSTHFLDAVMFWVPMYRFNALLRLITGVVSLLTVYHLIKILPQAFKQKTNVELENEIARREEAERRLAEANTSLESFAYVASHDLQEPLRKIRTYTSMLCSNNADRFDENSKATAEKLMASSARMQTMITDVLALSTLTSNVEFTEVAPNRAVNIALQDLEVKIIEKNAIINVGELPAVKGNEEYLAQLFMNLISNGIKFSTTRPVIDITGTVTDDMVFIHVKDNGIGILENEIPKIFQVFQRLHSRKQYEGSGIGLSICKRIVDVHNGKIEVTSKPGEGTTFIIQLTKA